MILSCSLSKKKKTFSSIFGKLVKVLTYIWTKSSLSGPVKKINCLAYTKTSFLESFKLFTFNQNILHALKALKA